MLKVGFGRACITPDFPVCLAGGGLPTRLQTKVLEDVYVTCVAFTDEAGQSSLLFTQDLVCTLDATTHPIRQKLVAETGIPGAYIHFSATHTHSAPTTYPGGHGREEFIAIYEPAVLRAAKEALADQCEATALAGQSRAKGMTFVRRYKLADGTYEGASGNTSQCKELVEHAYPSDETVQMIRFVREGKKDVLLCNLGAHATFNGATSKTGLSADFPSAIRDCIEARQACLVAYFISAAGDQTPNSRMKSDNHGLNYRQYGDRIGQLICEAMPALRPISTGLIKVNSGVRTVPTNRVNLHRLEDAKAVWQLFRQVGFKESTPVAHAQGFASVYEAFAIVRHADLPETMDIGINAMAIGDISFIFASYEMYGDNARFVRENSCYPMTFVTSLANGNNGYLPSEIGYEINCYEAYASNVGRGAGEMMAGLFLQLLQEMKEEN